LAGCKDVTSECTVELQQNSYGRGMQVMPQIRHNGNLISVFGIDCPKSGGIYNSDKYQVVLTTKSCDCGYWLKIYKKVEDF